MPACAPHWPRLGTEDLGRLYEELVRSGKTVADVIKRRGPFKVGFKKTALYYITAYLDEPPAWKPDGTRFPQNVGVITFDSEQLATPRSCFWLAVLGSGGGA